MSQFELAAAYHLAYDAANEIVDESGLVFDRLSYSRMKYGDGTATQKFADDLCGALVEEVPAIVEDRNPPEFLVAYKAVPPACYYLSKHCLDGVNALRADVGNSAGTIVKVHKDKVAATNYAAASPEEREKELSSIGFSLGSHRLTEGPVVILDDIRITGAAERTMLDVLREQNPRLVTLGYVAIFDRVQAQHNPGVENDLNASVVSGVSDLVPMIEKDNFELNIRTVKMILATPVEELAEFASIIPVELLGRIASGAEATGSDFMNQYATGYHAIKTAYDARRGQYVR